MTNRSRALVLVALVASLPIASWAFVSVTSSLPDFFNPCFTWGMGSGGIVIVSPTGPCQSAGGSSETVLQAILRMILIQGGILLASTFGVIGVFRLRKSMILTASLILILESAPFVFDGLFVLTIPPAILFLWAHTKLTSSQS
jgi:hypothetical protein